MMANDITHNALLREALFANGVSQYPTGSLGDGHAVGSFRALTHKDIFI
jgi:hypothetical protein